MRRRTDELTTGEWAVLALADEAPTHGFAIAQELAPGGAVGQVWSMRRPLVYRALDVLSSFELTQAAGTVSSSSGPRRTLIETTSEGARRVDAWLREPIDRVRNTRSDLLLKLLFSERRGRDARALRHAQRDRFAARVAELEAELSETHGFTRTLLLWRIESTTAAIRFVETLDRER
jgi:PadR family transcriptional regulator AphA